MTNACLVKPALPEFFVSSQAGWGRPVVVAGRPFARGSLCTDQGKGSLHRGCFEGNLVAARLVNALRAKGLMRCHTLPLATPCFRLLPLDLDDLRRA